MKQQSNNELEQQTFLETAVVKKTTIAEGTMMELPVKEQRVEAVRGNPKNANAEDDDSGT